MQYPDGTRNDHEQHQSPKVRQCIASHCSNVIKDANPEAMCKTCQKQAFGAEDAGEDASHASSPSRSPCDSEVDWAAQIETKLLGEQRLKRPAEQRPKKKRKTEMFKVKERITHLERRVDQLQNEIELLRPSLAQEDENEEEEEETEEAAPQEEVRRGLIIHIPNSVKMTLR